MAWTYFFLVDGNRIKIGTSQNPHKRFKQLGKHELGSNSLTWLAAVESTSADEGHIHRYFEEDRVRELKEVFYPTPRLTNYIRWLRNQWFAQTNHTEYPQGKVSFDGWEPNAMRSVEPPRPYPTAAGEPCFPWIPEPQDYLRFPVPDITADDYWTNPRVIECARSVMGTIDVDPATHPMANKTVKATQFYTITENGLLHQWEGCVWVNPPFSQWKLWVPKIVDELRSGRIEQMCAFAAMRTVTAKYFKPFLDAVQALCIITGRLPMAGKGEESQSPDDGHCVYYFGHNIDGFIATFSAIGSCWITAHEGILRKDSVTPLIPGQKRNVT